MEFHPFKAARAAGLRLDESMLKGTKGSKGDSKGNEDARDRSRSRDTREWARTKTDKNPRS